MSKRNFPKRDNRSDDNLEPDPEEIVKVKVVNCKQLNIRDFPSLTSDVRFVVNEGTILIAVPIDEHPDWAAVKDADDEQRTGFAKVAYLKEVE